VPCHKAVHLCYAGGVTTEPTARYWDDVYDRVGADRVSWFQTDAAVSLSLIAAAGPARSVIDIGGGASVLVDELLDSGIQDITVLDLSPHALHVAQQRLGPRAQQVRWLAQDIQTWTPNRRFDLWHDRAVFHFLTERADRDAYRSALRRALNPRGHVVIGTFAADGPTHCSGLPVARYDPTALAAQFPDLHILRSRRVEHVTPSGATQPFTWLLLAANQNQRSTT
jgi:trans-aconitate methyltransferase